LESKSNNASPILPPIVTTDNAVTMRDRGLVTMDRLQIPTQCGAYGHVTDKVTWP